MVAASPWVNPSIEQEQAWHEQRLAALESLRSATAEVLRIRDVNARRVFMSAYRERFGRYSAEALEIRVRKAWENR